MEAGHYVKMIHNGIEYADICNLLVRHIFMKKAFNLDNLRIAEVFEKWSEGELS